MDNIRFDTGGWLSGPMLDVECPTMAERIQLRWLRQQHPDFCRLPAAWALARIL
jgi:hypothetical protein